ncbi:MAG: LamG domain-containing protein, partial [Candidatus Schekmanbacteria bacterium]|nr:LamG domain-containing protein [Candidatus Schekmanbacteria bacterium]
FAPTTIIGGLTSITIGNQTRISGNAYYDDLRLYNSVQHTDNFTPPATELAIDSRSRGFIPPTTELIPDGSGNWPADLLFYAKYNSSLDADFTLDGSAVPDYVTGDVSIDNGMKQVGTGSVKLVGAASSPYVYYTAQQGFGPAGTISFWRYANPSLSDADCFAVWTTEENNDILFLVGNPSNTQLLFFMYDANSTDIFYLYANDVPNDTWHHVEINFDVTMGVARLFVDGILQDSTPFTPTTLASGPIDITIGNRTQGVGNAYYDDVRIYNSVQHTGDFILDKPYIQPAAAFEPNHVSVWDRFSELLGQGNAGSVRYVLSDDGGIIWKYWNGTGWVTGGDENNHNSAEEINSHLATFATAPDSFLFRAYLISDGFQQVELANVALAYLHVNYRVVINPEVDFVEGEVKKLNLSVLSIDAVEATSKAWWFKVFEEIQAGGSSRRVVIDPEVDFGEKEIITILAGGEGYSGEGLVDFSWWFETVLLPLLVGIQPGWPDVAIISKAANHDTAVICWLSSHEGDYQIEVGGSGKGTGIILGAAFGSQHVQGAVQAGVPIETLIKAADLEVASPADGEKRINIYVTDTYGRTNPWEG